MFNRAAYENSRPDGIGVLEVGGETEGGEGQPRLFVPLKRSELRGEIAQKVSIDQVDVDQVTKVNSILIAV